MAPRVESLREPTSQVVRLVALGHLADAAAARQALTKGTDPEALHDFRVALRRLRSWERAFRPVLSDDVTRKLRRQLRTLARDTGASRDLEVHIAWLSDQLPTLTGEEPAGVTWLLAALNHLKTSADKQLARDVDARFAHLRTKLERAFSRYRESLRVKRDGRAVAPPAFAEALVPRVRDAAAELRAHLDRIHGTEDDEQAHEARIAAKRLRYLLEPIARLVPGAAEIVERLKSLQDVLGDLHDAQVFGAEIAAFAATLGTAGGAAEESGAEPAAGASAEPSYATGSPAREPAGARDAAHSADATEADRGAAADRTPAVAVAPPFDTPVIHDPRPGIHAIEQRLRDRARAAYGLFAAEWLDGKSVEFFREVDALVARIAASGRGDVEIERKYLLRSLPRQARKGRWLDIEQGYVPGSRLHERVRRVRVKHRRGEDAEVRYYRTIKLGEGIARTEIEEETTREVFGGLWRLTKGHRLRKRRYEVPVDGHVWEIDVFRDRPLVLAEIELESEDEEVALPEWLSRAVEREVTGEADYQNINLAC